MEGTCAECGLSFAWRDLFHPDRFAPQWCVEFVPRKRSLPWASVKTLCRSLWPWGFWRRLHMSHPIHGWRIAAYLALLLALMVGLYAIPQALLAGLMLKRHRDTLASQVQALPQQIKSLQSVSARQVRPRGPFTLQGVPAVLDSIRIADDVFVENERQRAIASLQLWLATPPRWEFGLWEAMWEAVTQPFSDSSRGAFVYLDQYQVDASGQPVWASIEYPTPPSRLWSDFFNPNPLAMWTGPRGPWHELGVALAATGAWCIWLLVPLPLSLILLPVTRKRAKVRWAHVGRVFLYSLSIPIAVFTAVFACWLLRTFLDPASPWDEERWTVAAALAMPLATIAWWWAAIRNYLRMPHGLFVTLLMSVLCVLMTSAIVFMIGETFFA